MITDNIVIRILERIFDILLLNLLWVICSIPVFTIGASTTALYSVTLKLVAKEEGYIVKSFLKAFKNNFKQSTIIWMLAMLLGLLLGYDYLIVGRMSGIIKGVMLILLGVISLLYIIEMIFVFPLIAYFDNTLKNTMKNALLIPGLHIPQTIMILIIHISAVRVTFMDVNIFARASVIWMSFGIALISIGNSFLIRHMFRKHEKTEEK